MEAQGDFKELLALLNANEVEYVIVGGHALAFHGAPRVTGDMDLYVHPTPANARRVMAALREFGFGETGLAESDFERPGQVIQLGRPPVRVDFVTSITGLSWELVQAGRAAGRYDDVPVHYIGRKELVANKAAVGRRKDLADLEALGEA